MIPDIDLSEGGLLVVTGSTLRAEQLDRPLAYQLKSTIEEVLGEQGVDCTVLVLSDLWYLNGEALQRVPMVSIGGPGVNAVSANLFRRLSNVLVVDDTLLIQMDPGLRDLRASIWGMNHAATVDALELFVKRGYLERFLQAAMARMY